MAAPNLKFLDHLGKVVRRVHLRHFGKLKPSQIDLIMAEVTLRAAEFKPQMLRGDKVFVL